MPAHISTAATPDLVLLSNKRRVDFGKYAASFFQPYLFVGGRRAMNGCGASALALLTGVTPEAISAKNGDRHYSDQFVVRFLRARGFSVLELTWCNVSGTKSKIGSNHVILLSQLFTKNEGTWGGIFNGWFYHNFEIYAVEQLSFLNKPILSAYVVRNRKWRVDDLALNKSRVRRPRKQKNALALSDLVLPP